MLSVLGIHSLEKRLKIVLISVKAFTYIFVVDCNINTGICQVIFIVYFIKNLAINLNINKYLTVKNMKTKSQLEDYIKHGMAVKKRYQKANIYGQHSTKICQIDSDIRQARARLAAIK